MCYRVGMKVMSLRLPEDLYEEVAEAAGLRNVSMNWLIRQVLLEATPKLIDVDEFKVMR